MQKRWMVVMGLLLLCSLFFTIAYGRAQATVRNLESKYDSLLANSQEVRERYDELDTQNRQLTETVSTLEEENKQLRIQLNKHSPELNKPSAKTVYLTFDDGPSQNTPEVLDILKKYGAKATFFVCGNNTAYGHSLYKRMIEEGHSIGNHSYSHDFSKVYTSEESFMEEIHKLEDCVSEATGIAPQLIRFPGGSNNTVYKKYGKKGLMEELKERLLEEGYQYVDWNVDSRDTAKYPQDTDVIVNSVLNGIRGKQAAVVLMHDSKLRQTTVEALPRIIEQLQKWGYKLEPMSLESYIVRFK